MMAWRTVLFFSLGFCSSMIFPAISLLSTGKPNSLITAALLRSGFSDSTPSCLCTAWMLLSSNALTLTAGTLMPMLRRNTSSVMLSSPPTETWVFNPRRPHSS